MYDNLMSLLEIIAVILLLDFIAFVIAILCKVNFQENASLKTGFLAWGAHTVITVFVTWGVVG